MSALEIATAVDNWPTTLDRIDRLVAAAGSEYLQGFELAATVLTPPRGLANRPR